MLSIFRTSRLWKGKYGPGLKWMPYTIPHDGSIFLPILHMKDIGGLDWHAWRVSFDRQRQLIKEENKWILIFVFYGQEEGGGFLLERNHAAVEKKLDIYTKKKDQVKRTKACV